MNPAFTLPLIVPPASSPLNSTFILSGVVTWLTQKIWLPVF